MARLTKEHVLKDENTHDPATITSLSLSHKALSDVSCLAEFENLERLDLAFNNLTSLQGLKSCVNLKWLSVVQNKLQTLEGIEGLTKLTVLNAGKNKLRSMEEVKPLVNLRALILNDNEIVSIRGLDDMKDLNTLVLSRNPITEIGNSLVKLKSITKFSASNCQIQAIESSLKCCVELKELRLSHNDIKSLPSELSCNKKLQNLDLGNNLISQWSELKALDSLVHLKNLNLQGNPIAEKDKLAKKVKRLLPNLHIFNARPIDKSIKNKEGDIVNIASYSSDIHMEEKTELKRKKKKGNDKLSTEVPIAEDDVVVETEEKKKKPKVEQKGRKTNDKFSTSMHEDGTTGEEKPKRKKKLEKRAELDIIDDAGASFSELFAIDVADPIQDGKRKIVDRASQDTKSSDSLVTYPVKKKKSKHAVLAELELTSAIEVGMGGASTWGDE
ncbi:hypothetical protein E1A91_D08G011000v1 [Gossypium mustelinum]|uniref:Protein phosphatase 1 regulatory subunit 7 n=1 Tax=Gossypium mustelinum TaxID=34275 RepID=A0A5D2TQ61_GOSMU|nr:hypothetical protein E1A91_D13G158000v1 [Gossypium mustelinum]TYI67339.1 hypothetical protein E1A91_D08G011000v1 [Gossypium mustelinum]